MLDMKWAEHLAELKVDSMVEKKAARKELW